jgi:hypothetical protein
LPDYDDDDDDEGAAGGGGGGVGMSRTPLSVHWYDEVRETT